MKRFTVLLACAFCGAGGGCASLIGADFDRPAASSNDSGVLADGPSAQDGDAVDASPNVDASSSRCDGGPCRGTWSAQGQIGMLMFAQQVWGLGPKDLYVISGGSPSLLTSTGDGNWIFELTTDPDYGHRAIWGADPQNVYLSGDGRMLRRDATLLWNFEDAGPRQHFALWGSGANDVYVVGGGAGGSSASIMHSTGDGTWTPQGSGGALSPATQLDAIWGSGPNDIYAIAMFDVFHSSGNGDWQKVFTAPSRISALWGSGKDDVYVIGEQGGIFHRDASGKWTPQSSGGIVPADTRFSAIWGSGHDDVYIGGQNGVILHGTGDGKWTPEDDQLNEDVASIWGSSRDDVYAVTMRNPDARGSILHRKPPPP